jgi:hypothetical protein
MLDIKTENYASVQLTGISYPGYDVNIVLRVRETDCTDGVQSAGKENNITAGVEGNIQQTAGIKKNLNRPAWTLRKVITIYYVGGGSWLQGNI